jgi:hypothetical protein|tara:strand:+ start:17 stop:568 length:552 start_codon:yes stop_codon:yes gene_type:complete
VSTLRVNEIQHTDGASAITIDSAGNVTAGGFLSASTTENSGGVSMNTKDEADFLNLPSGIKRIQVNFYGVTNADASLLVRLGTTSGLTTSGYVSTSEYRSGMGGTDTSGFIVYGGQSTVGGIMTINHMGSNRFVESHAVYYNTSNGVFGGGIVTLGGTLDRVRVQGVSGGTFSAGYVNITYEL